MAQLLVESIWKTAAGIGGQSLKQHDVRVIGAMLKAKITERFIRKIRIV